MIKYFYFNDQLYPVDQPVLLPYDLALLRGYGIFDYFLFNQGQPRFLGDYLNRFINSAKTLGLDLRRDKTGLEEVIMEVIRANGQTDGGIRLFLSGGYAEDGYTPTNPNFAVLQYPFPEIPIHYYKDGIRLSSLQYQREVPKVKTTNYITGIKHQPWLKKQGSDFILYHDGKYVRESDRSNFFMINQEGVLVSLDATTLEPLWERKIPGGGRFVSSPALAAGQVLVGSEHGGLRCYGDASGASRPDYWPGTL